jgi:hypothetical protein
MSSPLERPLALWDAGEFEAAVQLAKAVIAAEPPSSETSLIVSRMLRDVGDWHGAERVLAAAIGIDAADPALRNQIAQIRLTLGRWREAWPDLIRGAAARNTWPPPNWSGEPLPGGTVLLYADGGLGDAIMYARYVGALASRARLLMLGPPALGRLFSSVAGLSGFVGDFPVPAYDRHFSLSYLPMLFGTEPTTVPAAVPYLHAEKDQIRLWRERLSHLPGRRVGLVWAGNVKYAGDRDRSIPLAQMAPVLRVPGHSFVSLQRGPAAAELSALPQIFDPMGLVRDLADTAALISALDLTITVDTSVVHVAGALGRPVWLLNRFNTDWRWLLHRNDSVWYPTLRQFRQRTLRDWNSPVEAAAAALAVGSVPEKAMTG